MASRLARTQGGAYLQKSNSGSKSRCGSQSSACPTSAGPSWKARRSRSLRSSKLRSLRFPPVADIVIDPFNPLGLRQDRPRRARGTRGGGGARWRCNCHPPAGNAPVRRGGAGRSRSVVSARKFVWAPFGNEVTHCHCDEWSPTWSSTGVGAEPVNDLMMSSRFDGNPLGRCDSPAQLRVEMIGCRAYRTPRGLRRAARQMRCGHSAAVRVAIEKCSHTPRRKPALKESMWSHVPLLAYCRTLWGRDSEEDA